MSTALPTIAQPELQHRLRRMIDLRGLARVSDELGITGEALARYLACIQMQKATFKRIESTLANLVDVPPATASERCPTCNSPDPAFHPAMRREGGVQVCSDRWHAGAGDGSGLS